jgi:2-haloacid dehalogenase
VPVVFAFDVYGTLVDPGAIVSYLGESFGAQAWLAARLWREKQLEFTFRRAAMHRYADFDVCTAQALSYVSSELGVALSERDRHALLGSYLRLPAFPDARPGLQRLKAAGHTIIALTNGTEGSVRTLLEHASLGGFFETILSADAVKSFKPDPAVYALVERIEVSRGSVWLVSANPFDVIGAKACGLKAAWLQRDATRIFDPWEFAPDAVLQSLEELDQAVSAGDQ